MQLLIKNNLTIIESVQLKGYGTSAMLELVDVQAKVAADSETDAFVDARGGAETSPNDPHLKLGLSRDEDHAALLQICGEDELQRRTLAAVACIRASKAT